MRRGRSTSALDRAGARRASRAARGGGVGVRPARRGPPDGVDAQPTSTLQAAPRSSPVTARGTEGHERVAGRAQHLPGRGDLARRRSRPPRVGDPRARAGGAQRGVGSAGGVPRAPAHPGQRGRRRRASVGAPSSAVRSAASPALDRVDGPARPPARRARPRSRLRRRSAAAVRRACSARPAVVARPAVGGGDAARAAASAASRASACPRRPRRPARVQPASGVVVGRGGRARTGRAGRARPAARRPRPPGLASARPPRPRPRRRPPARAARAAAAASASREPVALGDGGRRAPARRRRCRARRAPGQRRRSDGSCAASRRAARATAARRPPAAAVPARGRPRRRRRGSRPRVGGRRGRRQRRDGLRADRARLPHGQRGAQRGGEVGARTPARCASRACVEARAAPRPTAVPGRLGAAGSAAPRDAAAAPAPGGRPSSRVLARRPLRGDGAGRRRRRRVAGPVSAALGGGELGVGAGQRRGARRCDGGAARRGPRGGERAQPVALRDAAAATRLARRRRGGGRGVAGRPGGVERGEGVGGVAGGRVVRGGALAAPVARAGQRRRSSVGQLGVLARGPAPAGRGRVRRPARRGRRCRPPRRRRGAAAARGRARRRCRGAPVGEPLEVAGAVSPASAAAPRRGCACVGLARARRPRRSAAARARRPARPAPPARRPAPCAACLGLGGGVGVAAELLGEHLGALALRRRPRCWPRRAIRS